MDKQDWQAERRQPKSSMVDQHWAPPEEQNWKASNASSTKGQKPLKIPKVKEPKDSKDFKNAKPIDKLKMKLISINDRVCEIVSKGKQFHNKLRTNKVAPIHTKVQSRHLELEPLCCLSSCLVRAGCMTVVVFEFVFVVSTLLSILSAMSRGGFTFWEPIPNTVNGWFGHHIFFYAIAAYDVVLVMLALLLLRGILYFNKRLVYIHYVSCFFSLAVNMIFLAFTVWALCTPGEQRFSFINCLLLIAFSCQVPLQIWAISVVKSCHDFFGLIHVFVSLAES
ncbi:unnamed protein product [Auanema sp. JU1783]|nr:unnamed protein product [Auanema sp. JU1783]